MNVSPGEKTQCSRNTEELWLDHPAVLGECWHELWPFKANLSRIQRHNALVRLAIVLGILFALVLRSWWPILVALGVIFISLLTAPDPLAAVPRAGGTSPAMPLAPSMECAPPTFSQQQQPPMMAPVPPMPVPVPVPVPVPTATPAPAPCVSSSPSQQKQRPPFPKEPRHMGLAADQDAREIRGKAASPIPQRRVLRPALQSGARFVEYLRKPVKLEAK